MVERLADDHARARRLADALAERLPGSVDPERVETNIVCACASRAAGRHRRRRSPTRGVLRGHHRPSTRCASSRTRTSTTPTSIAPSPRSTTLAGDRLTCRYARRSAAVRRGSRECARGLRAPRRPRDLGRAARSPSGRPRAPRCTCSSRRAATRAPTIPTPTSTRSPRSGWRRPPRRRALLGLAGHFHLGYPDGELADDRELRGAIVRLRARAAARGRAVPRPHRGVLRRRLLQPPRPPRHRVGHARRGRAGGRQPALLPRALREGLDVHQVRCGLPVGHARAEHVGRHRRHARAQDRGVVLPREPARRDGRLVPPVPPRPGRAGRAPARGCATPRRSAASPS